VSIAEAILDKVQSLPPEKQQKVLQFADSLVHEEATGHPRRSLEGLWSGLNTEPITEEDIAEARQEMWGNFPRDFPE
jgi:hypothetical protein